MPSEVPGVPGAILFSTYTTSEDIIPRKSRKSKDSHEILASAIFEKQTAKASSKWISEKGARYSIRLQLHPFIWQGLNAEADTRNRWVLFVLCFSQPGATPSTLRNQIKRVVFLIATVDDYERRGKLSKEPKRSQHVGRPGVAVWRCLHSQFLIWTCTRINEQLQSSKGHISYIASHLFNCKENIVLHILKKLFFLRISWKNTFFSTMVALTTVLKGNKCFY